MTHDSNHEPKDTPGDDFVRVPGLFRRWELPDVVQPGDDFHLEEAGAASDGTPLFALYRREHINHPSIKEI